nr:octapeptide-repeat protein T2-like [Solanum lycopersicum]
MAVGTCKKKKEKGKGEEKRREGKRGGENDGKAGFRRGRGTLPAGAGWWPELLFLAAFSRKGDEESEGVPLPLVGGCWLRAATATGREKEKNRRRGRGRRREEKRGRATGSCCFRRLLVGRRRGRGMEEIEKSSAAAWVTVQLSPSQEKWRRGREKGGGWRGEGEGWGEREAAGEREGRKRE